MLKPKTTKPRTALGRRLLEIRKRIVASATPLLDWKDLAKRLLVWVENPIVQFVCSIQVTIALIVLLILGSGCINPQFHLRLMEKHSHYEGEIPAKVAAEDKIMAAFGVNDESKSR